MIISDIRCQTTNQDEELSAKVSARTSQDGDFQVWFRMPEQQGNFTVSGDPLLAGFLIPCMYAGENLHIEGPISERLLKNLDSIQSLITTWYPQFQKISITCAETYQALRELTGINKKNLGQGSCFSGGVDSWYSLLKHQETISHLILVKGFDMKTEEENQQLWMMVRQNAEMITQSLGKQLITITTNLRTQSDLKWLSHPKWAKEKHIWGKYYPGNFWGECLHGSSLVGIGLLLRQTISELIIPSTYGYAELGSWGSHPLLDPLWSTDSLSVIHDGCEADRLEKIKQTISQSDLALKTLRVCYKNPLNQYNCCSCEKCTRTMIQLRIAGCLEKATSFPKTLDLQKAKLIKIQKNERPWYKQISFEAQKNGDQKLLETSKIILGEHFSAYRFYHQNIKPFQKNIQSKMRQLKSKLKL